MKPCAYCRTPCPDIHAYADSVFCSERCHDAYFRDTDNPQPSDFDGIVQPPKEWEDDLELEAKIADAFDDIPF